jgi:cytochrome c-type biogenesis protein CcmH
MTWLLAIALALVAFALGAFVFGVARRGWTTFAAALALGLAGYAMQASPGLPGAPAADAREQAQADWGFIDARREMVASADRSQSREMIVADALARQGQYANAAAMLREAVRANPRDAEAWLALGNALVEHADGALTQPALLAYRRAAELDPTSAAVGNFIGFALIRQGRLMEARQVWASTLETAAEDAEGRAALEERLARLDQIIAGGGAVPPPDAPSP